MAAVRVPFYSAPRDADSQLQPDDQAASSDSASAEPPGGQRQGPPQSVPERIVSNRRPASPARERRSAESARMHSEAAFRGLSSAWMEVLSQQAAQKPVTLGPLVQQLQGLPRPESVSERLLNLNASLLLDILQFVGRELQPLPRPPTSPVAAVGTTNSLAAANANASAAAGNTANPTTGSTAATSETKAASALQPQTLLPPLSPAVSLIPALLGHLTSLFRRATQLFSAQQSPPITHAEVEAFKTAVARSQEQTLRLCGWASLAESLLFGNQQPSGIGGESTLEKAGIERLASLLTALPSAVLLLCTLLPIQRISLRAEPAVLTASFEAVSKALTGSRPGSVLTRALLASDVFSEVVLALAAGLLNDEPERTALLCRQLLFSFVTAFGPSALSSPSAPAAAASPCPSVSTVASIQRFFSLISDYALSPPMLRPAPAAVSTAAATTAAASTSEAKNADSAVVSEAAVQSQSPPGQRLLQRLRTDCETAFEALFANAPSREFGLVSLAACAGVLQTVEERQTKAAKAGNSSSGGDSGGGAGSGPGAAGRPRVIRQRNSGQGGEKQQQQQQSQASQPRQQQQPASAEGKGSTTAGAAATTATAAASAGEAQPRPRSRSKAGVAPEIQAVAAEYEGALRGIAMQCLRLLEPTLSAAAALTPASAGNTDISARQALRRTQAVVGQLLPQGESAAATAEQKRSSHQASAAQTGEASTREPNSASATTAAADSDAGSDASSQQLQPQPQPQLLSPPSADFSSAISIILASAASFLSGSERALLLLSESLFHALDGTWALRYLLRRTPLPQASAGAGSAAATNTPPSGNNTDNNNTGSSRENNSSIPFEEPSAVAVVHTNQELQAWVRTPHFRNAALLAAGAGKLFATCGSLHTRLAVVQSTWQRVRHLHGCWRLLSQLQLAYPQHLSDLDTQTISQLQSTLFMATIALLNRCFASASAAPDSPWAAVVNGVFVPVDKAYNAALPGDISSSAAAAAVTSGLSLTPASSADSGLSQLQQQQHQPSVQSQQAGSASSAAAAVAVHPAALALDCMAYLEFARVNYSGYSKLLNTLVKLGAQKSSRSVGADGTTLRFTARNAVATGCVQLFSAAEQGLPVARLSAVSARLFGRASLDIPVAAVAAAAEGKTALQPSTTPTNSPPALSAAFEPSPQQRLQLQPPSNIVDTARHFFSLAVLSELLPQLDLTGCSSPDLRLVVSLSLRHVVSGVKGSQQRGHSLFVAAIKAMADKSSGEEAAQVVCQVVPYFLRTTIQAYPGTVAVRQMMNSVFSSLSVLNTLSVQHGANLSASGQPIKPPINSSKTNSSNSGRRGQPTKQNPASDDSGGSQAVDAASAEGLMVYALHLCLDRARQLLQDEVQSMTAAGELKAGGSKPGSKPRRSPVAAADRKQGSQQQPGPQQLRAELTISQNSEGRFEIGLHSVPVAGAGADNAAAGNASAGSTAAAGKPGDSSTTTPPQPHKPSPRQQQAWSSQFQAAEQADRMAAARPLIALSLQCVQLVELRYLDSILDQLTSLFEVASASQPLLQSLAVAVFDSLSRTVDLYRRDPCIDWYMRTRRRFGIPAPLPALPSANKKNTQQQASAAARV